MDERFTFGPLYPIYVLILDALDMLVLRYEGKRSFSLLVFVLKTIQRNVNEMYNQSNQEFDKLNKQITELKNNSISVDTKNWYEHRLAEMKNRFEQLTHDIHGFLPDEIKAMKENQFIEAIKLHRMRTTFGLKESKDIVEAYMKTHKLGRFSDEAIAKAKNADTGYVP